MPIDAGQAFPNNNTSKDGLNPTMALAGAISMAKYVGTEDQNLDSCRIRHANITTKAAKSEFNGTSENEA